MLPHRRGKPGPSEFIYLDNPLRSERRMQEGFRSPPPPPSGFFPMARNTPRPPFREMTNWVAPQHPRKMMYDAETRARIEQEEKAMLMRQEKQRQKALKAMQISEDRRRRLLEQKRGPNMENISQGMAKLMTEKPQKETHRSDGDIRKILKDPTSDFLTKKSNYKAIPQASGKIFKYTVEELKALRPVRH